MITFEISPFPQHFETLGIQTSGEIASKMNVDSPLLYDGRRRRIAIHGVTKCGLFVLYEDAIKKQLSSF